MSNDGYPNALFHAHMMLYRWGSEALAKKTVEVGSASEPSPASTVGEGSFEPLDESIPDLTSGPNDGAQEAGNGD